MKCDMAFTTLFHGFKAQNVQSSYTTAVHAYIGVYSRVGDTAFD